MIYTKRSLRYSHSRFTNLTEHSLDFACQRSLLQLFISNMTTSSSLIPPAQATFGYWNLLPRELRLLILSKTHLVRRHDWIWNELASAAGPTILHGRLLIPAHVPDDNVCDHAKPELGSNQCNRCVAGHEIPFPIALFTVSKQMYEDVVEVFWSQRFVLRGDFHTTARWLDKLGEASASKIKKMHLVVEDLQVWEVAEPIIWQKDADDDERWTEYNLESLIENIQRKCNLGKLCLSIDVQWSEDSCDDEVWSNPYREKEMQESIQRVFCEVLFKPMAKPFHGCWKLARFHVFLGWGPEDETAIERSVMGGKYDSALEGKVAFNEREVRDPLRKRLGG